MKGIKRIRNEIQIINQIEITVIVKSYHVKTILIFNFTYNL